MTQTSSLPLLGIFWALIATLTFSVNDMLIKFLSDGYALHQIVFTRSLTSVIIMAALVIPLTGGFGTLRTQRLGLHLIRASFVIFANLFFYMALADLPLATVVAIFFVAPFLITIFSVIFLHETVGPWRWASIIVGFTGVLLIVRPGTNAFDVTTLFPMAAAACYAAFHIMTRKIGPNETLQSLTFYTPLLFLIVAGTIGLIFGNGWMSGGGQPTIEFLFRQWVWPDTWDLAVMIFIGTGVTLGGAAISQAYRVAEAALVAPFEYTGLIYATAFGWFLFSEWPDAWAWAGMALVLGSGLVMVWREAVNSRQVTPRIKGQNAN